MENNIKIVRLKNGEDIIGNLKFTEDVIDIVEPMSVSLEFGGSNRLIMSHWLPVQLIKKNETKIHSSDVLAVFDPNDDLVEYYSHTVEKIARLLKDRNDVDNMSDEDMDILMSAMEESEGKVIH